MRRRLGADQGGVRDARRGRLPARARVLRDDARAEAHRRPDVPRRPELHALQRQRHGRVRRLRLRPARRRGRQGDDEGRPRGHPVGRVRGSLDRRPGGRRRRVPRAPPARPQPPDRAGRSGAAGPDAVPEPGGRGGGRGAGRRDVGAEARAGGAGPDGLRRTAPGGAARAAGPRPRLRHDASGWRAGPGAGLTAAEKLEVARQLARLKVDVIEAGFPAASDGDFEAVRRIAQETKGGIAVAALARCRDGDPQRAIEAIKVAERPHLHVFIATSDIHLKHKLRIDRETGARRGGPMGRLRPRAAGAGRRDRVLGRGCLAHGPGLPDAGLRGRRRGRRLDDQHPRHRRLRDPVGVRGARRAGVGAPRRAGDDLGPLSQRPRPGDGQHARGGAGRCAPGRGDDQRPRRARGQRLPRGGRDGAPHAARRSSGRRGRRPGRSRTASRPSTSPPPRAS